MSFKDAGRNEKLISQLEKAICNHHISHAYLFEGSANLNKKVFALDFIKAILCSEATGIGCGHCVTCKKVDHGNHEDIIHVEADGRSVKDQAIQALQTQLKTKPLGPWHIAVINDADTMTLRAQNRLLKTLEEPFPGTVLILLSENTENLTKTILSRCVKYRLPYFQNERYNDMDELAGIVAEQLLTHEPFYKVKSNLESVMKEDKKTAAFLDAMEVVYRDLLLGKGTKSRLYKKNKLYANVTAIEEAKRLLQRGVAKRYALKQLLLKMEAGE